MVIWAARNVAGASYDATGSYDAIFWGGVVLGIGAAFVHLPIDSAPLPRPVRAGAPGTA